MAGSTFLWVALAVWLLDGLARYCSLCRHGHPHPVWLLGGDALYEVVDDPSGAGVTGATERLETLAATLPGDSVTVVVGTRGRGLSQRLMGSVAEGLLKASTRPVLVSHQGA